MTTIPEELAALVDHPLVRATVGVNIITTAPPNPYYQDAGDDEDEDADGKDPDGYPKFPGAPKAIKDMTDGAPKHLSPTIQTILNGHVKWWNPEDLMQGASNV